LGGREGKATKQEEHDKSDKRERSHIPLVSLEKKKPCLLLGKSWWKESGAPQRPGSEETYRDQHYKTKDQLREQREEKLD